MKQLQAIALGALTAALLLVACGDGEPSEESAPTSEPTADATPTGSPTAVGTLTVTVELATPQVDTTPESNIGTWVSNDFGVQFDFELVGPDPFRLSEASNPEPGLVHAWSLVRQSEIDALQPNAFGPRGMIIELFEFTPGSEPESAEAWVRGTSRSNLGMGDGELRTRTVGGVEGVRYSWSGLYEGTSVVVLVDGRIWMFSMLYREDISELGADFGLLLDSVVFLER
jgi:hypothetical protein